MLTICLLDANCRAIVVVVLLIVFVVADIDTIPIGMAILNFMDLIVAELCWQAKAKLAVGQRQFSYKARGGGIGALAFTSEAFVKRCLHILRNNLLAFYGPNGGTPNAPDYARNNAQTR